MLKVGITGLMGSGKSYISSLFSELGVPVYNSDERAKWLNNNIGDLKLKIIDAFGDVYTNNKLDTIKIRRIVFSEGGEEKLKRLNQICHPYVIKDFEDFCNIQQSDIVIAESAILFESGYYKSMDKVIFVDAPYSLRLDRVYERDGITQQEYDSRMKNQMSIYEKRRISDFTVDNSDDGDRREEVKKIYDILLK